MGNPSRGPGRPYHPQVPWHYQPAARLVILDTDLAALYGVEAKVLNQAVKRNLERFPEDFMFQLTEEEFGNLKSQGESVAF